ncbi:hypothetical protein L6164_012725 [Bauhinia variegata]|uniref:Uncharacterized protein n=1 Tax=Bauhinia variegata TaxID=167791 RepID=A0ACB9PAF8_BAUVA|nr:hypothetical protein L6164_012725 [Bauhinia variegata]
MPARKEQVFTTIHDNQTLIIVYEGEEKENHLLGYFKIMEIPAAPKGVPVINVSMDIDVENALRVSAEIVMPGSRQPAFPPMEVKMPTVDDGHGWCAEALRRAYGPRLGLAWLTAQKKKQPWHS